MSRAFQYVGERQWVDGVPFGSWTETGDCYTSGSACWPGDIDLLDRIEVLRRLVYELAHGNRPQLFEGRLHWYSPDENGQPHYLNQPLTDAEVAEWALICEVGE